MDFYLTTLDFVLIPHPYKNYNFTGRMMYERSIKFQMETVDTGYLLVGVVVLVVHDYKSRFNDLGVDRALTQAR